MAKKVGILSMQRIINYGSFLQAYALKKTLENLGAECSFIDIVNGRQLPGNEMDSRAVALIRRVFRVAFNLVTNWKQTLVGRRCGIALKNKFINRYYDMLGLDEVFDGRYDLVVIGSDEVFNCCQKTAFGYSRQLFGEGINAERVISYAASFGHTTKEDLEKFNLSADLTLSFNKFKDVSVRDNNSLSIISDLTGKVPQIHLDPVLIYDFEAEIKNSSVKAEDYIVIYTYPGRIRDKSEIQAICDFAKRHKKRLVSIYCWYTWCDTQLVPETPFDVLAYFKSADYIITDTFHGTIFSIINKKKFGTLIRSSNRQKLTSLLNNLSLGDRIVDDMNRLDSVLTASLSYDPVDKIILAERKRSTEYLQRHLSS